MTLEFAVASPPLQPTVRNCKKLGFLFYFGFNDARYGQNRTPPPMQSQLLRSHINPDTILRLAFTQIPTLQTAEARQSARKAKKRPKSPLPTTNARHDRNQATAHHYRRQLPHLRCQIHPDTILRDTVTFIASLQTAKARKSARKAKKRP